MFQYETVLLNVTRFGVEVWERRTKRARFRFVTECSSWEVFVRCGDLAAKHVVVRFGATTRGGQEVR